MTTYGVAPLELGLTSRLCANLAATRFDDLPETVRHEAKRALIDWIGCAMAGSAHPTIDKTVAALSAVAGNGPGSLVARTERLGLLEAAIANGQMGHILDFDDTHMDGVVLHASSPLYAALFALAERQPVTGRDITVAFTTGFEAGVRAGKAAPRHHDGGWHLTGTLGTIAAGVACGRLLAFDGQKLTYTTGISATQSAGMQQNRGTMCKSLHSGKAASNGLLAALLAEQGFDSSNEILEGRRGFANIYSVDSDVDALTRGFGESWELAKNGYKPYACGIVQHPLIDAMIALAEAVKAPPSEIEKFEARVHEAAVRITGVEEPETGLKSKFSLRHSAAVGYLDGDAGIAQYTDARAVAPEVQALRQLISIEIDDGYRKDEAEATIVLKDGTHTTVHIDHATGTAANPMSDDKIASKYLKNTAPTLGEPRAEKLLDLAWNLDAVDDFAEIVRACRTG